MCVMMNLEENEDGKYLRMLAKRVPRLCQWFRNSSFSASFKSFLALRWSLHPPEFMGIFMNLCVNNCKTNKALRIDILGKT